MNWSNMWPSRDEDRILFPLRTIGNIRKLFDAHIKRPEPNLALLSIVCGFVENTLTCASAIKCDAPLEGDAADVQDDDDGDDLTHVNLPIRPHVDWDTVETLMTKFDSTIKSFCDPQLLEDAKERGDPDSVRKLVKHVADIVWNTLSKSQYKDRPHLQSIYSYLTGNKLDCFGVAFAVVAACQHLGINEVHLALSEDHAWVVFGSDGEHTAEVTWHGKGNEDKRGRPVEALKVKTSWLYMAGKNLFGFFLWRLITWHFNLPCYLDRSSRALYKIHRGGVHGLIHKLCYQLKHRFNWSWSSSTGTAVVVVWQ